jgi:hypothetical protein
MTKSNNRSKSKSGGNSSSSSSSYGNVKINNYGSGGGGISSTRGSILSSRPRRINTNNWDGWKPIIQSCGGGTGASLIGCAAGPPIKIVSNLFTTKKIPAAAAAAASANNSTKTVPSYNMKDATPSSSSLSSSSSSLQAAITAVTASTNGVASSVSNNKRHWTGGVKNVIQHIKNNSDKWECKLAKIAAKVSSSSSSSSQHQHQQQQNDDYQFGPAAAAAATAVGTIDFNSFEAFHYEYLQNDVAYGQLYYGKQTTQDILIDAGLMNSPTTSPPPPSSSSSFVPKGASIKSIDRNLIIFLSNDIPTLSGTHRDGTHSILYVLSGTKSVYLAPPDTNEKMSLPYENNGSITNSLNYNPFQHQEDFITIMGEEEPNSNSNSKSNSNSSSCWKRVDLIPGESLYIPKGWWHNVYSPSNTVAFSIDISIDTVHSYRDAASEINLCNISGMAYNCNTKMSNIRDSIIAIEEEDIDNNDDDDDDDDDDDEDYYDEGKKRKALSSKNAGDDPRPSSSPPPVKKKKKKRRRNPLKSKVEGLEYETSFHGICPGIFPIIDNATTSRTAPLPPPPLRFLDQEIFSLSVAATATATFTTNDSNTVGPTTTEQQLQHPAGEQQQQQQQEPPLSPTPPPGALEEEEELQSLLSSTLPKYSPQSQSVTAAAAITPPEEVTQSPDDTKTVTAGEEEEEESFFFNITKTIIAFDNSKSKSKSDRGGRR